MCILVGKFHRATIALHNGSQYILKVQHIKMQHAKCNVHRRKYKLWPVFCCYTQAAPEVTYGSCKRLPSWCSSVAQVAYTRFAQMSQNASDSTTRLVYMSCNSGNLSGAYPGTAWYTLLSASLLTQMYTSLYTSVIVVTSVMEV